MPQGSKGEIICTNMYFDQTDIQRRRQRQRETERYIKREEISIQREGVSEPKKQQRKR